MSIQIFNIRLGFATNSSSTHSICFVGNNNMPESVQPQFDFFGWDEFTLATPAMKQSYVLTLLHSELSKQVGSFLADKTINGWYSGQYPEATALIKKEYSGIDHQSRIVIPRCVTPFYNESTFINEEFVEDLMNFVSSDRCVILGGNDNSDGHPLAEQYNKINFPTEQDDKFWRAKKDGNVWVLFNKENGSKFRFSFEQEKLEYNKSYVPELVDIKITDWCDKGCPMCYQGSTEEGKHADKNYISQVIKALSKLQVFEIAFGGGEPTAHPKFLEILRECTWYDIVPNFTTRNLEWLRNLKWTEYFEHIGGFAFSTESVHEIEQFGELLKTAGISNSWDRNNKCNIQLVLGTMTRKTFKEALAMASKYHLRVTLLGYKTTGRGSEFTPVSHEWWLDVIRELREEDKWVNIGVDTLIVQQYGEMLAEEIDDRFFTAAEGKFSCYIDAVSQQMAPSSFCEAELYKELKLPRYGTDDYELTDAIPIIYSEF